MLEIPGEPAANVGRPRGRAFTVNSSRRTRLYLGRSGIRLLTAYSFASDKEFRQDEDVVLELSQPEKRFWSVYSLVLYLIVIPVYASLGVIERTILASSWHWEDACVSVSLGPVPTKIMKWFLVLRSAVAVIGIVAVVVFLMALKNAMVYVRYMRFWCRLNFTLVVWTLLFSTGVLIFQRKSVSSAAALFVLSLSVVPVFGGLDFLVFHDSATQWMVPALRFFAIGNGYLSVILYVARRVENFKCGGGISQPGVFFFVGNALFGFVEAGYLIQVIRIMYQKLLRPSVPCVTFRVRPTFSEKALVVLNPTTLPSTTEADLETASLAIGFRDNHMRVQTSLEADAFAAEGASSPAAQGRVTVISVPIKGLRNVEWLVNLWAILAVTVLLPQISAEYGLHAARIQLVVSRECWIVHPITRAGEITNALSLIPPTINFVLLGVILGRAGILVAFLRWVRHWLRCNYVSGIAGLVWGLGAFFTIRGSPLGIVIRLVNTLTVYLVFALLDLLLMLFARRVRLLRTASFVFFAIIAVVNPINYTMAIARGNPCDPQPPTSRFYFYADKADLMAQAFFILRVLGHAFRKLARGMATPNMGNYRGPRTYIITDATHGVTSFTGKRLVERSPSITPIAEESFL